MTWVVAGAILGAFLAGLALGIEWGGGRTRRAARSWVGWDMASGRDRTEFMAVRGDVCACGHHRRDHVSFYYQHQGGVSPAICVGAGCRCMRFEVLSEWVGRLGVRRWS